MSPVKQTPAKNPRTLLLAVGGVAIGIILVVLVFIIAVPKLTESDTVTVQLGSSYFAAGSAENRAKAIEEDGPILLPDVASGSRDIFLQHTGDDLITGWLAFDARRPGTTRDCTLVWEPDNEVFRDPCVGDTVSADGAELVHYSVEVTQDGTVVIDLATSTGGTSTTTS